MTEHRINLNTLAESLRHGQHAIFSASGSAMWMNCAGSLIPNLLLPDSGSQDAAYGTVGHGVAEMWLKSGIKPRHLIDTDEWIVEDGVVFHVVIDEEMLDFVQEYVDWCTPLEGHHYVETRVDFSEFTPLSHQGGTCDHAVARPGHLTITDLKMGKGIRVHAKGNTQLMLYALGFFLLLDEFYEFQTIVLRIAQPRMENMDVHEITREELLEFAEQVRVRSAAAWTLDAPRKASPKACQWCKVGSTCVAYVAMMAELTANVFPDLTLAVDRDLAADVKDKIATGELFGDADVMTLSTKDMVKLLPYASFVTKWWGNMKAELSRRIAAGETDTGLKLVESNRTKRKFRNEAQAVAFLLQAGIKREDVVSEVVCTPATAEKLYRKAMSTTLSDAKQSISAYVHKPPGRPVLVPLEDKRPALTDINEGVFNAIESETQEDEEN